MDCCCSHLRVASLAESAPYQPPSDSGGQAIICSPGSVSHRKCQMASALDSLAHPGDAPRTFRSGASRVQPTHTPSHGESVSTCYPLSSLPTCSHGATNEMYAAFGPQPYVFVPVLDCNHELRSATLGT